VWITVELKDIGSSIPAQPSARSPDRPGRSQRFEQFPGFLVSSFAEELQDQFIFHLRQLDVNKINTRVDKNNVQMMSSFDAEKFKP
jgi:hypothetical protein